MKKVVGTDLRAVWVEKRKGRHSVPGSTYHGGTGAGAKFCYRRKDVHFDRQRGREKLLGLENLKNWAR